VLELMPRFTEIAEHWLREGIGVAMNTFNH
jgi:hypothetical protein